MRLLAPSICIVNVDTTVTLAEIEKVAAALTRQCLEHFAPVWGLMANVRAATAESPCLADEWRLELRKVPTQDGALGFHNETDAGLPVLYVFPELCAEDGETWSSCASHEILEALVDPFLHRCAQAPDGSVWDVEICDRVEGDTYLIDGVSVSNFNTPACFEPPPKLTGVAFDYLCLSSAPNEVRPDGYAQRWDGHAWNQVGEKRSYRKRLDELQLSRGRRRVARGKAA